MKKLILMALSFVPALVWAQSSTFIINARIGTESAPVKAYLIYPSAEKSISDSAMLDKGVFRFKGMISDPVRAQLVVDHKGEGLAKLGRNADFLVVFLEKGEMNITAKDSVKNSLISGSKLNDEYKKYGVFVAAPDKAITQINVDYAAASDDQRKDQNFIDGLQNRFNKTQEEKRMLQVQYIKQHPGSYLSLLALMDVAGDEIDVPIIEPLYKSLSADILNTATAQGFAKSIDAAHTLAVGAIAPAFTENDVNDKPVSLAAFRGKYVLLDFWASWCAPCRAENPNVVKAYHQYKDKNFTVLGVSLDRPGKKADWLAAIKADGLEWTQVSDLKFWNNEVAKRYGIRGIPQNYLIDPTGKIIGKNLRGEELNKKLASLLN